MANLIVYGFPRSTFVNIVRSGPDAQGGALQVP